MPEARARDTGSRAGSVASVPPEVVVSKATSDGSSLSFTV